jgi:predicted RND superfamily exporter protein
MAISVSYGIAFATILTLILLPIFISLNNQVKVIFKWLVSGKMPNKELVERAIIEKKEDEKIEKMEVKKNQGL